MSSLAGARCCPVLAVFVCWAFEGSKRDRFFEMDEGELGSGDDLMFAVSCLLVRESRTIGLAWRRVVWTGRRVRELAKLSRPDDSNGPC